MTAILRLMFCITITLPKTSDSDTTLEDEETQQIPDKSVKSNHYGEQLHSDGVSVGDSVAFIGRKT